MIKRQTLSQIKALPAIRNGMLLGGASVLLLTGRRASALASRGEALGGTIRVPIESRVRDRIANAWSSRKTSGSEGCAL
jgi:hypothetical protein